VLRRSLWFVAAALSGKRSPTLAVSRDSTFRNPARFPAGARFAAVDRDFCGDFLGPFVRRDLYVAIVSRCWETDVAALAAVLREGPSELRYLGLMGSRRKIARVREEVEKLGHSLVDVPLRAPIGLPLGGDSPGEIAISIFAEILTVRHGRNFPGL
jgi:xanthine dehydrogenase accessory factor